MVAMIGTTISACAGNAHGAAGLQHLGVFVRWDWMGLGVESTEYMEHMDMDDTLAIAFQSCFLSCALICYWH